MELRGGRDSARGQAGLNAGPRFAEITAGSASAIGRSSPPRKSAGTRVSPATVSDLNKKIYGTIEAWRNRPIEGEHPYVYPDGIVLSAPGLARCATCRFCWRSR